MPTYRISQAAALVGVSDDTMRRWIDAGRLGSSQDDSGKLVVDGAELAHLAQELAVANDREAPATLGHSVRNRFPGLVTRVVKDAVMAQVEIQCGSHRVVSLLSREAVDELGLEPGVIAIAAIKATNVSVVVPGHGA